jgi:single-stranded-DNA-specific exonuclease
MTNEKSNFNSVESLRNFHWEVVEQDLKDILFLTQKCGISDILAKVLINRGIKDVTSAENFLHPKIKNLMPNPFLLKDMEKAANRIAEALTNNEKIIIYADYDVDGATSSALLKRFFRIFNVEAEVYIPCRFKEGYGPNIGAFKKLIEEGAELIITVDCGTVAFESISYAKKECVDVIVVDHHLAQEKLPDAYAVINPNRVDDTFPYKEIAAVAVGFFVITAVRSVLRQIGYFKNNDVEEPKISDYLDLVALGTVCDVMPLTNINRAFVQSGLHVMEQRKNVGITALADIAKIDKKLSSYHLGFVLGPRINAGGRIGKCHLGSDLLSTDVYEEAYELGLSLEKYNDQRKSIEGATLENAIISIERKGYEENSVLLATGNDWHLGVLGILASRLKGKYQKPVLVISLNNGVGKGSARSINGVDIGVNIAAAKKAGLLIDGGGHAMAGGFTVAEEKIDDFYKFLLSKIGNLDDNEHVYKQAKILKIDSVITVNSVTPELFNNLSLAEPFGQSNQRARFIIINAKIIKVRIMGTHHLMFILKDNINNSTSNTIKCILFNGVDDEYGKKLIKSGGRNVNVVGHLQVNFFDQNKVDFIIEDICFNE